VEDLAVVWEGVQRATANVIKVISQAFTYMSTNGHKYGAITTYETTWLLQCVEGNVLSVSKGFKHTDVEPSTGEVRPRAGRVGYAQEPQHFLTGCTAMLTCCGCLARDK